jgi:hypothetical protein
MELFHKVAESWGAVRWKMLVIFAFFSIISTVLVAAAFVAFLNVVVRRENTNLIQERISAIVDSYNRFAPFLLERVAGCQTLKSNSPILEEYSTALWAGSTELGDNPTQAGARCNETALARHRLVFRRRCRPGKSRNPRFTFRGTRRMSDIGAGSGTVDGILS